MEASASIWSAVACCRFCMANLAFAWPILRNIEAKAAASNRTPNAGAAPNRNNFSSVSEYLAGIHVIEFMDIGTKA
ncbi:MAG: hypothetical protein NTX50_04250 [Candidatus Sumerlaeota bacterium]|nr:hypothetical protein [Candidatus Sumerlaeota bacterium]